MSKTPLVSSLIIFYNPGRFFREAIESVFAQTFTDWELILADDGSTDGSLTVAQEYAQRFPEKVRLIQHPGGVNKGMSATRNLGLAAAQGEYLALLDADDIWTPNKLTEQVALMDQYPQAALVFGRGLIWHSWTGRPEDKKRDWYALSHLNADRLVPAPEFLTRWLQNEFCQPGTSELLCRTELLRGVGGWDESFKGLYEDNVLYTRLLTRYPVYFASNTWYHYRQHDSNCCYSAMASGEWAPGKANAARERILLWIERYLDEKNLRDLELRDALQAALEPYRYPVRYQVRQFPLRVARRLKTALAR